jgi:hypothetical protein
VLCAAKTNDPESGKGLINLESPSLGHPQSWILIWELGLAEQWNPGLLAIL